MSFVLFLIRAFALSRFFLVVWAFALTALRRPSNDGTLVRRATTQSISFTEAERKKGVCPPYRPWRSHVKWVLENEDSSFGPFRRNTSETGIPAVFQFGVHTGVSLGLLMRDILPLLGPKSYIVGFDSFRGLPAEENGVEIPKDGAFRPGEFDFGVGDQRRKSFDILYGNLPSREGVEFVEGFFNESLTSSLAKKFGFRGSSGPVVYVDIDVDLYSSSAQVLRWLAVHEMLRPGTLVGYDDWWATACCAWPDRFVHPLDVGEGRAHKEISEQFGIQFECVTGSCAPLENPSKISQRLQSQSKKRCPTAAPIFRVKSVAGKKLQGNKEHRPHHGFDFRSESEIVGWMKTDTRCMIYSDKSTGACEDGVTSPIIGKHTAHVPRGAIAL